MSASDSYQLLDFGAGRKLERFGPYVLDRPSPAADRARRQQPELWNAATARFERRGDGVGVWQENAPLATPWHLSFGDVTLELKLTEFGHLGIFPEQAGNWQWIADEVRRAERPKVLNLFAYTGGSTLAAAAAGAEVVHVDAAANVVAWARRNAELSGLAEAPIRWIVDDAVKFVRRELKRGQKYDAVLLDPPAYGHGPAGQSWKLAAHLDELVAMCFELCRGRERFMLLTCHSGELATAKTLLHYARELQPASATDLVAVSADMNLGAANGSRLPCGAAVRWSLRGNPQSSKASHARERHH
jgi:23S rRNA (cytosine1962-C5)-methyltransferase